jgi:hypothetical protein
VEVVKNNVENDPKRGKAFVWDLGGDHIPPEVEPEAMDVLVLIFVLSALHPDRWEKAMNNLYKVSLIVDWPAVPRVPSCGSDAFTITTHNSCSNPAD